jgi:pSer/pThr/pTyr-binding forkhead associated (FHA) protein
MEPTLPSVGGPPAELIVRNGRLQGSARPLAGPLTLIGRAPGCDLRLNVQGVRPLHCGLVQGPLGVHVRDLQGSGGTLVNGVAASDALLKNGDILTVGPFQFELRMAETQALAVSEGAARVTQEREALRIQAAAVVAQQAALGEEEARLQQKRSALEQQEAQLAAHLEEKRGRLIELRDQAREAYSQLRNERTTFESEFGERQRELAALRREAEDTRSQARSDRQRLLHLHRRMKQRWHRHWSAERAAMHQRHEKLAQRLRELDRAFDRLRQEKAALQQARLAFNGEVEIGRRHLQAAWDKLHEQERTAEDRQAQALGDLADQQGALDEREAILADAERDLIAEQQRWQEARLEVEKEVESLDGRVRNYRRKIFDLQEEVNQLQKQRAELKKEDANSPTVAQAAEPAAAPLAMPVAAIAALPVAAPATRLPALEKLAGELADQRLHLIEQGERLVRAQHAWHKHRDAVANDLEAIGRRLHEREQAIQGREQALENDELRLRQQQREAVHLQHFLEGWQTRMTARESAWEGERDRLVADLRSREALAAQRLAAVDQLHQRWTRRRHREVEWLRGERATGERLRREWVALRDDCHRRKTALEKEQRALAERALAMEQYQQEVLGQSGDAPAAGRRLEKLRRRWSALSAAAEKSVAEQRQALEAEAARLDALHERLQKHAAKIANQEGELSRRMADFDQGQLKTTDELEHLRHGLTAATTQRARFEREVLELHEEVERLARLLLDEAEPVRLPQAKAA